MKEIEKELREAIEDAIELISQGKPLLALRRLKETRGKNEND